MTFNCDSVSSGPSFLPVSSSLKSKQNEISIISWNILLDYLAEKYPEDFPGTNPHHLTWKYRLPLLASEILHLSSDIVCLQECHLGNFVNDFEPYLKDSSYSICLNNGKKVYKKFNMTIAVLYKNDKLNLIYKDLRSRSMLLLFNFKSDISKFVIVVNMHLAGHPIEHIMRVNSIKSILQRITTLFTNNAKYGVNKNNSLIFICGDFNTTKDECVFHYLNNGILTPEFRNKNYPDIKPTEKILKHDYKFNELYDESYKYKLNKNEIEYPSYIGTSHKASRLIDFIFYNKGTCNFIQNIKNVKRLFKKNYNVRNEQGILKPMPNKENVSDHVPIGGIFNIKLDNNPGNTPILLNGHKENISKKTRREKKKKKKKNKKKENQEMTDWQEISSF